MRALLNWLQAKLDAELLNEDDDLGEKPCIVLLAIILFTVLMSSSLLPVFGVSGPTFRWSHPYSSGVGLEAFFISLYGGAYRCEAPFSLWLFVGWLANPAFLLGWMMFTVAQWRAAVALGIVAFLIGSLWALGLLFVLATGRSEFAGLDIENYVPVWVLTKDRLQSGYFVWMASFLALSAVSYYCWKRKDSLVLNTRTIDTRVQLARSEP